MRKNSWILSCLFLVSAGFISCHTSYTTSTLQYKDYRISDKQPVNKNLENLLHPYSDNVSKSINTIVGNAPVSLDKKSPKSALGNFIVHAFFVMAKKNIIHK